MKLLAIKDSDIRILTLEQCRDAVDKGLHAGGAFSATIPLVALFYGSVLLGEPLTLATLGGLVLILVGVEFGSGALRLTRPDGTTARIVAGEVTLRG